MISKASRILLSGAVAVSALLTLPTAASADGAASMTSEEIAAYKQTAADLGMTPEATASALEKISSGKLPDSSLPAAEPVWTDTERNGFTVTESSHFADGSVSTVSYPDFEAMAVAGDQGLLTSTMWPLERSAQLRPATR